MPKKRVRRRLQRPIVRKCYFCEKGESPTFGETQDLNRFLTERGKIVPRLRSGLCTKHQRQTAKSIKHARHLGLLPFVVRG